MLAMDLKMFLHKTKVLFMTYICNMIFMQMKVYKRSNCSWNMAKKGSFPIFNI